MKVPLAWLADFLEELPEAAELASGLTLAGLEVEGVRELDPRLADHLVIARIDAIEPHPNADRLSVCTVDDGTTRRTIVCGARNMAPGDFAVLALPGAVLPSGLKIGKARIRGVESEGMLCSAAELDLYDDHTGILILGGQLEPGAPAASVLGLAAPVLEIAVTPNRGDCLSIRGVAREVAAVFGLGLSERFGAQPNVPAGPSTYEVRIEDRDACPFYRGIEVDGVTVGSSPAWLAGRLAAAGLRPLSNVVDVTNYVLLEYGQPLHAFDRDRLVGTTIFVRRLAAAAQVETLDGQQRRLAPGDTVIADAEGPVAIAGVMGGARTAVSHNTTRLFLESAVFDARQVRRTSRRLGLVSESSYRFERGVDPAGVEPALLRAVELLVEVGGARATHAVVGDGEQPPPREPIRLRPARIERVLGAAVGATEAARLLERLGAACELDGEGSLLVRVPSARHDLAREIDLIEEVARLRGYDRLPAAPPAFEMAPAEVPAGRRLAARVRERLAGMGLSEAVTLAFATASDNERFPGFHEDGALRLSNPLRSEQAYLRRSLIPGLLTAAVTNVRGGVRAVALFSCGRTFSKSGERECVAGLLCGPRPGRGLKWAEEADFFDAKAAAEAVVAAVRPAPELKWRRLSDWPGCHPGACAAGCVGGTLVAVAGLVHPEVTEELELPATAVFEVALDRLAARPAGAVRLAPISKYPAASRDVSLLVPEDRLAGEVIDLVRGLGDPRVEDVWLFDEYRGAGVPDGYRALGFSIVYRAPDYTMTDEEIQELHERVVDAIVRELGAERRV